MRHKKIAIRQHMKLKFDRLSAKFAKAYQNIDPTIADAEIQEAFTFVRKKKKKIILNSNVKN